MFVPSGVFNIQRVCSWVLAVLILSLPVSVWGHRRHHHPCGHGHHHPCPTPTPTPTPSPTPAPTPVFTSTAPSDASEGETYSYEISAVDPASGSVALALVSGPEGAAIEGATLTWTPTHTQSRRQSDFVVSATSAGGGIATQSFSVTPRGNIVGTSVDTFFTKDGVVLRPNPMGTTPPVVYIPDGQGGYTTITGTGSDVDGTFSVPGVPAGTFVLASSYRFISSFVPFYVWSTSSDLVLGHEWPGRPDCTSSQFSSVPFVSFASPLSDPTLLGGTVTWYSGNSGFLNLAIGSVSADPFQADVRLQTPCLFDPAKGDDAYALHYFPSTANPQVQKVVEVIGPLTVPVQAGNTASVTDPFISVPDSLQTHPVLAVSDFEGVIGQNSPASADGFVVSRYNRFSVIAQPYADHVNVLGPNLLQFSGTDTADLDLGEIWFGNPLPDHTPYAEFRRVVEARITLAGSSVGTVTGGAGVQTATLPSAGAPLAPVIGMVVSPKIDGNDFFAPGSNLSLTPTLSWDPPTLGTPSSYGVFVYELGIGVNSYTSMLIYTKGTQITLPPGIIKTGRRYVFLIHAYSGLGASDSTPFVRSDEFGYAAAMSALQQPPEAVQP